MASIGTHTPSAGAPHLAKFLGPSVGASPGERQTPLSERSIRLKQGEQTSPVGQVDCGRFEAALLPLRKQSLVQRPSASRVERQRLVPAASLMAPSRGAASLVAASLGAASLVAASLGAASLGGGPPSVPSTVSAAQSSPVRQVSSPRLARSTGVNAAGRVQAPSPSQHG